MNPRSSAKRLLVLGAGAEVTALIDTLSRLPNVASVRQQSTFVAGDKLPDAHLCIEMLGGLGVAYSAAIQALAQGMGLIIGTPPLAALHGQMLAQAAQGQGAYFACTAHGFGVMPSLLQASGATQAMILTDTPAQSAVARLQNSNTPLSRLVYDLKLQKADLTDWGGKTTHSRAHALLGAWQNVWPTLSQQPRLGVESLDTDFMGTPASSTLLNTLGLTLAYGSTLSAEGIYTGPLALPQGFNPPQVGQELLLAQTPAGPLALTQPTAQGPQAAAVAATQAYLQGQKGFAALAAPKQAYTAESTQQPATLILSPLQHLATLSGQAEMLNQAFAGQSWAAVLQAPRASLEMPEGTLALPLVLPYAAVASARLRLVG